MDTGEYVVDPNVPKDQVVPNDPDILINPDISAVQNVPLRWWKRVGNTVVEMTQTEKDALVAAELQARKDQANDFGISEMITVLTALIKVINIRLTTGQKITKQEMVDALKAEIT